MQLSIVFFDLASFNLHIKI